MNKCNKLTDGSFYAALHDFHHRNFILLNFHFWVVPWCRFKLFIHLHTPLMPQFAWQGRNDSLTLSASSSFSNLSFVGCLLCFLAVVIILIYSELWVFGPSSSLKVEADPERQFVIACLRSWKTTNAWPRSFKTEFGYFMFPISGRAKSFSGKKGKVSGFGKDACVKRFGYLSFLRGINCWAVVQEQHWRRALFNHYSQLSLMCSCHHRVDYRMQHGGLNLSSWVPEGQNQAISTTPSIRTLVLLLPGQCLWKNVLCLSLIRLLISWDLDEDTEPNLKKNTIGVSVLQTGSVLLMIS